jgi:hypothetical protein
LKESLNFNVYLQGFLVTASNSTDFILNLIKEPNFSSCIESTFIIGSDMLILVTIIVVYHYFILKFPFPFSQLSLLLGLFTKLFSFLPAILPSSVELPPDVKLI